MRHACACQHLLHRLRHRCVITRPCSAALSPSRASVPGKSRGISALARAETAAEEPKRDPTQSASPNGGGLSPAEPRGPVAVSTTLAEFDLGSIDMAHCQPERVPVAATLALTQPLSSFDRLAPLQVGPLHAHRVVPLLARLCMWSQRHRPDGGRRTNLCSAAQERWRAAMQCGTTSKSLKRASGSRASGRSGPTFCCDCSQAAAALRVCKCCGGCNAQSCTSAHVCGGCGLVLRIDRPWRPPVEHSRYSHRTEPRRQTYVARYTLFWCAGMEGAS